MIPKRMFVRGANLGVDQAIRQWPLIQHLMEDPRATFRVHVGTLIPTNPTAVRIMREHPYIPTVTTIRRRDPDYAYTPTLMPGRTGESPIFQRMLPGGTLNHLWSIDDWKYLLSQAAQPDEMPQQLPLPLDPPISRFFLWDPVLRTVPPFEPRPRPRPRRFTQPGIPELIEQLPEATYVPRAYEIHPRVLEKLVQAPGFRARIHGNIVIPLNDWTDELIRGIFETRRSFMWASYKDPQAPTSTRPHDPVAVWGQLPGRFEGSGPLDAWAERLDEALLRLALTGENLP